MTARYYYVYGFLVLVALVLVVTCAEITVVLLYFQVVRRPARPPARPRVRVRPSASLRPRPSVRPPSTRGQAAWLLSVRVCVSVVNKRLIGREGREGATTTARVASRVATNQHAPSESSSSFRSLSRVVCTTSHERD